MDISKLSHAQLNDLVKRGIIQVMVSPPVDQYQTMADVPVKDLPDFEPFRDRLGLGLSYSEASRRYGVPQPTIHRWAKRELIPVIGKDKNRVLIDEAHVAYYASRYKEIAKSGRRTDRIFS